MTGWRRRLFVGCSFFLAFLLSLGGTQSAVLAEVRAIEHRIYVDGKPFLITGDTAWTILTRISYEDALYYLSVRKRQGFNTILADIIPARREANFYGDRPFLDRDMTRPNEAYWRHIDRLVQNMADDDFLMIFKSATLCCDWGQGDEFNEKSARAYGRFLGKRYGKYNIVWVHCGDRDPFDKKGAIKALVAGIREVAPQQLHSCHPNSPHSAADVLPHELVDLNLTYTYSPETKDVGLPQYHVYDRSRRDFNRLPQKPFFLGESHYESPYGDIPNQIIRRQAYWSILSGSTGQAYGHYFSCINTSAWRNFLTAEDTEDTRQIKNVLHLRWQDILTAKGAEDMRHVKDVFLSRNWVDLVPDQAHRWVIAGYGTYNSLTQPGGDDYVTAAYTPDAGLLIAYVPAGNTLTVDLRQFRREVEVKWFDPTNGSYSRVGRFSNHSVRQFSIPGKNGDGDRDWVLIAESSTSK